MPLLFLDHDREMQVSSQSKLENDDQTDALEVCQRKGFSDKGSAEGVDVGGRVIEENRGGRGGERQSKEDPTRDIACPRRILTKLFHLRTDPAVCGVRMV